VALATLATPGYALCVHRSIVVCDSVSTSSGRPPPGGSGNRMKSRERVVRRDSYRGDSADVSRLLDSLLHGYDKRLRPNYSGI